MINEQTHETHMALLETIENTRTIQSGFKQNKMNKLKAHFSGLD